MSPAQHGSIVRRLFVEISENSEFNGDKTTKNYLKELCGKYRMRHGDRYATCCIIGALFARFFFLLSICLIRAGNPERCCASFKVYVCVCEGWGFKDKCLREKIFTSLQAEPSAHVTHYRCLPPSLRGRKTNFPLAMPISVKIPDFFRLTKIPVRIPGFLNS